MSREEAINRLANNIYARLYNPKEEDKQALNIAIHDMLEIEKLAKKIEYYDKQDK